MSIRRWTTRGLGTALLATAVLALAPLPAAAAGVPVLVLDGTGYGHGVGLSQWGAEYMARTGHPVEEILGTFYPGVQLAEATGPVRVAVHQPGTSTTTLSFPQGGEVRSALEGEQAPGFPVVVGPGGRVRITYDGAYRVDVLVAARSTSRATRYRDEPCSLGILCPPTPSPSTTAPPPTSGDPAGPGAPTGTDGGPGSDTPPAGPAPASAGTARSGSPVWSVPAPGGVTTVDDRGRSYRGVVEATGAGALRLVNLVDVEDYLRGMAEVPGTWPAAAVQAQTVAARTYALRAMQASGEICDDARCQVYVGQTAEAPGKDAAVAATSRWVLVYGGALAAAVYSADAGGVSATTLEGFGTPDGTYPYLTAVPYDTDNPLPWHVEIGLPDLGRRLGYRGSVTGARVGSTGPSGRALSVVVEGSSGDMDVDGRRFARALGLRSTRFTATLANVAAAPAPPAPAAEEIQGLPEEAAAAAQHPPTALDQVSLDRQPVPAPAATTRSGPPALDPRRHLATLLALVLVALVAGAQVPLALRPRPGRGLDRADARASWPWRRSTRIL